MKISGEKLSGVNVEEIFIPRQGKTLHFIAKGVNNLNDFDKICPKPKPPTRIKPGGVKVENVEDPTYKLALTRWGEQRFAWMIINSLRDTPGLEWEKVDYGDANSWTNWQAEMLESGFVDAEIQRIIAGVMSANGLNEARIEEARKSFLAIQEAHNEQSISLLGEQQGTPSGEPANAST